MKRRLATLAFAAAVLAAPPAGAEDVHALDAAGGGEVRIWTEAVRGAKPGWGYVRVRMRNDSPHAQRLLLDAEEMSFPRGLFKARGNQALAVGETAVREIPIPTDVSYAQFRVAVEGSGDGWSRTLDSPSGAVLVVGTGAAPEGSASKPVRIATANLPSRWPLLASCEAVVVDGGDPDLDVSRQGVLRDYVEGGGTLFVTGHGRLQPGPLRSLREESLTGGSGRGRRGLGRWVYTEAPDVDAEKAWGAPEARLLDRLEVPGVGAVPVRMFFFLILGFAFVNGPLAYLWLRRKRRLGWMLVTIPATGFGCAAAILLYGLLVDGLGTKGSVWSVSVLDQARGRVATAASRTLYAGVSPNAIHPDPGTLLLTGESERFLRHSRGTTFRMRRVAAGESSPPLRLDLDRGDLDGSALPARTPTALGTVSQGPARDRLRFRRRDDGRYDVLAEERFSPVAAEASIVLRMADGRWFSSDASGVVLEPGEGRSRGAVDGLLDAIRGAPGRRHPVLREPLFDGAFSVSVRWSATTSAEPVSSPPFKVTFEEWAQEVTVVPSEGAFYLARMRSAPFLDMLGLDVEWRSEEHVVIGLLGPEDVLE